MTRKTIKKCNELIRNYNLEKNHMIHQATGKHLIPDSVIKANYNTNDIMKIMTNFKSDGHLVESNCIMCIVYIDGDYEKLNYITCSKCPLYKESGLSCSNSKSVYNTIIPIWHDIPYRTQRSELWHKGDTLLTNLTSTIKKEDNLNMLDDILSYVTYKYTTSVKWLKHIIRKVK